VNPYLCKLELRTRNPLEIFDLSLLFFQAHASSFLRLSIGLILPIWLLLSVICWLSSGAWWILLLLIPLFPWLQAPITLLGGHLLFHDSGRASTAVRTMLAQSPRVLQASIVEGAALFLGLAFCGYGVLPAAMATLFLPEAILLEQVPLGRAIQRANRFAVSHVVISIAGVVARFWLTLWCAAVAEAGGHLLLETTLQLGRPFGSVLTGQVTPFVVFGILAAQPLHALYRLLLYVDVRTRDEGWDLKVALRAVSLARESA